MLEAHSLLDLPICASFSESEFVVIVWNRVRMDHAMIRYARNVWKNVV